jgi:hypothetical protein
MSRVVVNVNDLPKSFIDRMSLVVRVCKSFGDGFCGVDVYSEHNRMICRYVYNSDLSAGGEAKSDYFVVNNSFKVLRCKNEVVREKLSNIVENCINSLKDVNVPINMITIVPKVYSEFRDECVLVKGEAFPSITGGMGNRLVITF